MEDQIQESGTPEIPPVDPAIPDVTVPTRAPRRRGRTTLLIAAALALGAAAGTVTGYAVQYQRPPTALPPLAQQKLDTPKALAPNDTTTAKSVNANRWHKTDGDLTELLLPVPDGAKAEGAGYIPLDAFAAGYFQEPGGALADFAEGRIRRVASTSWTQGQVHAEIQLVQFRERAGAEDFQRGQSEYMPEADFAGNRGVAIPGVTPDLGHVWVDAKADGVHGARALARRGDIVVDIHYYEDHGKIAEADVIDLAKKQLERL
ncbi:hypothetical protein EF912_17075 [Streptomyces sp. WAC07061]|uniref:hypothetical protein n=1 Tax=Streptomyces sp. WAC07061 TaxID=2487410 RepID=UPI000F7A8E9B|nr:hypothetical protein [Streptomyces sp. WAC07061]RSS54460.1 hypothetical protein EF912_17075 [Streptomyces sp. WAC07061]